MRSRQQARPHGCWGGLSSSLNRNEVSKGTSLSRFAKTGLEALKERVLSAIQTMKAAADHVANTVDDDGNYQALEYLIVI